MQKVVVGVGTDCGENEYMFELKNFTRFAVNWVKLVVSLFTGYHELIGKSFFIVLRLFTTVFEFNAKIDRKKSIRQFYLEIAMVR